MAQTARRMQPLQGDDTRVLRTASQQRSAVLSSVLRRPCRTITLVRAASSNTQNSVSRRWFHESESGLKLEVLSLEVEDSEKPTLLFIHGAGHGAWCWQEKFMPYFKGRGYSSHALSLKGQAGSQGVPGAKAGGTLDEHADDISHFISKALGDSPVLVGHSFGGLAAQSYLLRGAEKREKVKGLALLASAPPQGSSAMIGRFFRRQPWQSILLTWSFIFKTYLKSPAAFRRLFLSSDIPESELLRFQGLMKEQECAMPVVEVGKLKESVPLPSPPQGSPPVFVLGGLSDYTVDKEGFQETAAHWGVEPCLLPDLAHDVMLDTRWKEAADALEAWCSQLSSQS